MNIYEKLETMVEAYLREVQSQIAIIENKHVPNDVKVKIRDWVKHGLDNFGEIFTCEDLRKIQQLNHPSSTLDRDITYIEKRFWEALSYIQDTPEEKKEPMEFTTNEDLPF